MILQRTRILAGDAGFEPGNSAPDVWCSSNEPLHLHQYHMYCWWMFNTSFTMNNIYHEVKMCSKLHSIALSHNRTEQTVFVQLFAAGDMHVQMHQSHPSHSPPPSPPNASSYQRSDLQIKILQSFNYRFDYDRVYCIAVQLGNPPFFSLVYLQKPYEGRPNI